jgi:hypothetical protein
MLKFGNNLRYKEGSNMIELWWPSNFKILNPVNWKYSVGEINRSSLPVMKIRRLWNGKFTKSNIFKNCIVCGSDSDVEMHHIRSIRDLRNSKSNWFSRQMSGINRKQVPLCKDHHIKIHNNTMTEEERESFKRGIRISNKKK